jgi:outer membrane protein
MRKQMLGALLLVCGYAATSSVQGFAQQSGTPPPTSTASSLTLQQAEAIALKNNPQISVARLRALESREFVREVRSSLLPQASLNLTAVGSDPGSRLSAGALNNPSLYPRVAAGASVSQLIADFGRSRNLVSSSEFQANAEAENAAATQQQIVLAVDEAFYNVLETKALRTVAEETVKTRQLLVDQVQALTNAKLKSDLDLSFSQVDLSRGKLLLLESQSNYEASLSTLSAILGYAERRDFVLIELPAAEIPPAPDPLPLIQQALEQRPEIRSLKDEVSSEEKFGKAEHDLWRPTINALGVVGVAPVRDPNITSWYGAAGVNVNIPIFNGYLFNARAKAADLETQARRQRLQDLQNFVARDVRNSWLDTQKAYERLTLTRQLREQANLALELSQARYKLGLGSIVEYSQANLQKTEADLGDTDAHYQYLVSQIMLTYMIGARH